MSKQLEDMTFNEIIDAATMDIHFGLLEDGSKGMKNKVHTWMFNILRWQELQKDKLK